MRKRQPLSPTDSANLIQAFALVIASDWLHPKTLGRLACVSSALAPTVSESSIWQVFLQRNSILRLGHDHDGCPIQTFRYWWRESHIPPSILMHRLRVPPRPHGPRYDAYSYEPHPSDRAVHGTNLVLPSLRDDQNHVIIPRIKTMRFNDETGALEDLFHVKKEAVKPPFVVPHPLDILLPPDAYVGPLHGGAAGGPGAITKFCVIPRRTPIWIKRELPIYCPECKVHIHSYAALIDHCASFEHQKHMNALEIKEDVKDWEDWSARDKVRGYLANNAKVDMFDLYDRRCNDLHSNMSQMYKYWLTILLVIFISPMERLFANYYDLKDFEEALLFTQKMSYVFAFLFLVLPTIRWWKIHVTKIKINQLKSKVGHYLPNVQTNQRKKCD